MSGFLLDTNVPSELIRTLPEPRVKHWVASRDQGALFLSVVTIGEFRRGFALLPDGKRRRQLELWFENHLMPFFAGRILPVTEHVADWWGRLDGRRQLSGRPLGTADGMIAATAMAHGLTLVTRNVNDFAELGLDILNPWESTAS